MHSCGPLVTLYLITFFLSLGYTSVFQKEDGSRGCSNSKLSIISTRSSSTSCSILSLSFQTCAFHAAPSLSSACSCCEFCFKRVIFNKEMASAAIFYQIQNSCSCPHTVFYSEDWFFQPSFKCSSFLSSQNRSKSPGTRASVQAHGFDHSL